MPHTTRSNGDLYLFQKEPVGAPVGVWLDWAANLGVTGYRNACLDLDPHHFSRPVGERRTSLRFRPNHKTVDQLAAELSDFTSFYSH